MTELQVSTMVSLGASAVFAVDVGSVGDEPVDVQPSGLTTFLHLGRRYHTSKLWRLHFRVVVTPQQTESIRCYQERAPNY